MNTRTIVAVASLFAAAAVPFVVVACADPTQDCKLGTLRLQVQLDLTASLADTITVQAYAPPFKESFPHTPSNNYGEVVNVDVTFPDGYPTDKLITMLVRASGQGQTIGENIEQIHMLPGCTVGGATISTYTVDAAPVVTDGGTD